VSQEVEDSLEDKIRAEDYKLTTGNPGELDCEMCFIHGYMRGSESPARIESIVRQAVELARATVSNTDSDLRWDSPDEIVEVIMKGLEK